MTGAGPDRGALRLLAALSALNVLSYVDRQMVAALAPLLIADLRLTRAQIGFLIGAAFILVFALATLAMGIAADRASRPRLLARGLTAWSAATGLSGTAGGFASLALWRGLVGIGEATLAPTALSMLADRFPPGRLGLANGVFYAGIPVGFAFSFALAGALAPRLGWRACFFALGLLGVAAVGFARRIADPARQPDARSPSPAARGALASLTQLLSMRPAALLLILAASLLAFASSASQLGITWLVEERGFAYARAAWLSALITAGAGLAGSLLLGITTDRARRRDARGRLLAFAAIGICAYPVAAGFYLLPSRSPLFLPCWFATQGFMLGWFGPLFAAIAELCPAGQRAGQLGLALLVVNVLGVAAGPWLTGAIGDRSTLTAGLLASLAVGALGVAIVAAVALRGPAPAEAGAGGA